MGWAQQVGCPLTGELSWGQRLRGQQAGEGALPGPAAPSIPGSPVCIHCQPSLPFLLPFSLATSLPPGLQDTTLPNSPLSPSAAP